MQNGHFVINADLQGHALDGEMVTFFHSVVRNSSLDRLTMCDVGVFIPLSNTGVCLS